MTSKVPRNLAIRKRAIFGMKQFLPAYPRAAHSRRKAVKKKAVGKVRNVREEREVRKVRKKTSPKSFASSLGAISRTEPKSSHYAAHGRVARVAFSVDTEFLL